MGRTAAYVFNLAAVTCAYALNRTMHCQACSCLAGVLCCLVKILFCKPNWPDALDCHSAAQCKLADLHLTFCVLPADIQ